MAKLHEVYKDKVVAELQEKFGFSSVMQVPQIEKITLNMGVGEALADKKILDHAVVTTSIKRLSTYATEVTNTWDSD